MTLVQRFGSALNLSLHFHLLFIDDLFLCKSKGDLRFHRVNAPTFKELNATVATISERVARYLDRRGRAAREGWGILIARWGGGKHARAQEAGAYLPGRPRRTISHPALSLAQRYRQARLKLIAGRRKGLCCTPPAGSVKCAVVKCTGCVRAAYSMTSLALNQSPAHSHCPSRAPLLAFSQGVSIHALICQLQPHLPIVWDGK